MTVPPPPQASLSHLHRADGSATYSYNGYGVVAAVNGPVEVTRRDELPEEAAIDVVVRPNTGVGGVKERHLESIIQSTLRHIILVHLHPRTLIQVTLQVTTVPEDDRITSRNPQATSYLPILPALLQASILALLSASLPLVMTFTATLCAMSKHGVIVDAPSVKDLRSASSLHVFAFSSRGHMLANESEGSFNFTTWEKVYERARQICHGNPLQPGSDEDVRMAKEESLEGFMREFVTDKMEQDQKWRAGVT